MLGSKHVSLKVSILTFGIVFIIFVASLTVFLLIIKIQPFKKHKTDQVKEKFDSDEALLTSTVGLKSSYLTTKYQEDKTMTTSMKRPLSKEFSECQEYIFFKGDGFCDDDVNTPECNFDGGDCCGENIAIGLCGICLCHTNETYLSTYGCMHEFLGDKMCDDGNNIKACNFDNEDCCGQLEGYEGYLQYLFCDICKCYES